MICKSQKWAHKFFARFAREFAGFCLLRSRENTGVGTVEEMTLKTGKYQKRLKKTAKRQKALLFITIGCICIKFRHICPSFDDFWRNSRKLGKESPENTMAGFFKKKIVKQSLLTKFKNLLVLKSILTHFRRD
jgi:hypothetical protein